MATAAEFFSDIKNTVMCILYEYLRGLTPQQARNELKKAGISDEALPNSSIIKTWFARFKAEDFRVDVPHDAAFDNLSKQTRYEDALREYEKADVPFDAENLNEDLMEFLTELDEILNKSGVKINELEINVKNEAQPSHVLIGIEYSIAEGDEAEKKQYHVVEVYHCATGVVVRRGKTSKLFEANNYCYYPVAIAICHRVIDKLKKVNVKTRTLRIDKKDTEALVNRPVDSINFFGKLKDNHYVVNSSVSLMELAKGVQGLEELNLKYDADLLQIHDVFAMRENFDFISAGQDSMKCTITIQVSDELVTAIAGEELLKDDDSRIFAKSDEIRIVKGFDNLINTPREFPTPEPAKTDDGTDSQ